jgi:hypothetical protein
MHVTLRVLQRRKYCAIQRHGRSYDFEAPPYTPRPISARVKPPARGDRHVEEKMKKIWQSPKALESGENKIERKKNRA